MTNEPTTIADREEIAQLMARYNMAGDRGDVVGLAANFTVDGVIAFSGRATQGRAAIAARLGSGEINSDLLVTRHHLSTSLIDVQDDSATGRTYFSVLTNIGLDHHGVYVDRFERVDGSWLIARREVRIDYQSDRSLYPPLHIRGRAPDA